MPKSPKSKPLSKHGDSLPPVIESSNLKPLRDVDHTLDIEAVREDALREVKRLLRGAEAMSRVPKLIKDYTERRRTVSSQFSAMVHNELEEARAGMDLLAGCESTIQSLRENVSGVASSCTSDLLRTEVFSQMCTVFTIRRNASLLLKDIDALAQIPEEIEVIRELLDNPDENTQARMLAKAHKSLIKVSCRAEILKHSQSNPSKEVEQALMSHLRECNKLFDSLGDRVWSIIKSASEIAPKAPGLLISALQVVKRQDYCDVQYGPTSIPDIGPMRARNWGGDRDSGGKLWQVLKESFQWYFQTALEAEEEEDGSVSVGSLCAAWDKVKADMNTVYDYVAPCFPPEWDFFSYWCNLVHRQYENQVELMRGEDMTPPEIVQLIAWSKDYNTDMDRQFAFKPDRPLLVFFDDLLKVYEHKACEKLMEWSTNIIKADRDAKPDLDPRDGLLYTQAPLELMRMITQQVEAIVEFDNNHLVNRIWKVGLSVFRNYAIGMREEIRAGSDGEPDVYMFIAACNNSFKLLDMTNDLASKEDNANVDTSQVEDALITYGRDCQFKITQEIMKDLQNSFLYFFCCPEDVTQPNWLRNSRVDVCGVILGTVRDYFDDFKAILHVSAFRKVVEQVLENCIIVIIARICVSPYTLGKTFTKFSDVACDVFEEDIQGIIAFFKTYLPAAGRVDKAAVPLTYCLELMRAVPMKFDKGKISKEELDVIESNLKFGWAGLLSVIQDVPVEFGNVLLKGRGVDDKQRHEFLKQFQPTEYRVVEPGVFYQVISLCKVHNDQIYEKLKKDEKMKMPEKPKASKAELKAAEEKKKKDAADKKEQNKLTAASSKLAAQSAAKASKAPKSGSKWSVMGSADGDDSNTPPPPVFSLDDL